MFSKNLLLLLGMSMLLGSVSATFAYTYASSTPYCAAPGELTLGIEDQSTVSAVISFDSISTYYNADFESVPLMVKNGDGTSLDFKFYSYTNNLAGVTGIACTGSAAFMYIDLVGSYLFLHNNATSKYVVCQFDHTAASITPVILDTASLVTGSISQFDPYLTDGTTLYVLVGDGTASQVVSFDSTTGASTKVGTPITGGLLSAAGNNVFLYDETDKVFLASSGSAWAAQSVIGSVMGKIVKVTGLRQNNLIVNVISNNKYDSTLYSVSGNTASQVTTITGSTFEVMDYTDGVNDFIHVTSSEMTWLTLPNSASATLFKSTIPASVNTELGSILNVGLSGNKAVVLYSSNKLEYLKHTGADAITVLFSRSYNSGDIASTGDKQYKLSIKCMCAGVNRLACFSATLNCVIIRKAGVECHQGQDINSKSW